MLIVSAIPGRVRLENKGLIGKTGLCAFIKERLYETDGVACADINPRTGRILLRFDELHISNKALMAKVNALINEGTQEMNNSEMKWQHAGKGGKKVSDALVHAVIDMAGQTLMPKSLRILLPVVVNAMMKNL